MMGRRIRRVVVSCFSFLFALFCAAVAGLIAATVSAYALVYCLGLPLVFICELLGGGIGEATLTVGAISLIILSLLTGLTLGAEVYLGVARPELPWNGPTPGWLRALWAAAAGALVGALPCAVGVDWLLHAAALPDPHALDSVAALGTAAHIVSLGGLMGATTGLAMERFRIWRRPSPDMRMPSSKLARPAPRETDAAEVRAHLQTVLPVDQQ